ncbi:aquaporin-9-like isoform X2 [Panonychus citri]|uniref:aquaporin-9-like isoform X2 n=1 Tax=Panonychus citri TaxID=50023 RepID=UPI002307109E|nr:aquaporin-9-like isoform X2 [Panonychus citri]
MSSSPSPQPPTSTVNQPVRKFLSRSNQLSNRVKGSLASKTCKQFLAEMIGTFFVIALGDAATAAYKLRTQQGDRFDYMAVNFCFATGVLIGVSATISISGAHLNPAVTTAMAAIGKFKWSKVWYYLVAQYVGGILASAVVYLDHFEAIEHFDPSHQANITGEIFATYPARFVTIPGAFVDQMIGTSLLLFGILAVSDGIKAPLIAQPALFAVIITGIPTAFNYNCGAILNPARDFAPRLFSALVRYGWEPFQPLGGHYWWAAGIVGPHVGGILGAWLYLLTVDHEALKETTSGVKSNPNPIHNQQESPDLNLKDVKEKSNGGSIVPRIAVE